MYRFKAALRRLLYGPPPRMMGLSDWLDPVKVQENLDYPWFKEEYRELMFEYARAYVDLLGTRTPA